MSRLGPDRCLEPSALAYPELVGRSARLYVRDLQRKRASMSAVAKSASDQLVATIESALAAEAKLGPADLSFGVRSLDGIGPDDRRLFVNQYVLGTGWDGAPLVVMGTEAAEDYSAANAEELAFHCLYVVLQVAGGSQSILRKMVEDSTWESNVKAWNPANRRYDFEPNDLLELNMGRPRTWRLVAEIAAGSLDRRAWGALLEPRSSGVGLGALAYQVERSAHAALRADLGTPPSDERVAFLADEVIPRLRDSSSTLILHGFGGRRWPEWWPRDEKLIRAFLNHGGPIDWRWETKIAGQFLEYLEVGQRRALYTRALNGPLPSAYKESVIRLVHDEAATWPPCDRS